MSDSMASLPPCFQELALSTLMKFVQLEGAHPLEKPKWEGSYLFPRQLLKVRVQRGPGRLLWPPGGMAGCRVPRSAVSGPWEGPAASSGVGGARG